MTKQSSSSVPDILLLLLSLPLLPATHGQERIERDGTNFAQILEGMKDVLKLDAKAGEKLLAAQVNAVAVLDMIKKLEDEMKVI